MVALHSWQHSAPNTCNTPWTTFRPRLTTPPAPAERRIFRGCPGFGKKRSPTKSPEPATEVHCDLPLGGIRLKYQKQGGGHMLRKWFCALTLLVMLGSV